jgi:hypothetical protein
MDNFFASRYTLGSAAYERLILKSSLDSECCTIERISKGQKNTGKSQDANFGDPSCLILFRSIALRHDLSLSFVISGVLFSRFSFSSWALRRHGFLLYAHFSRASVVVHVGEHVQGIFGIVKRGSAQNRKRWEGKEEGRK